MPFDLLVRQSATRLGEIPRHHFLKRDAHAVAGVAPEMLVGEKQHLFTLLERPLDDLAGIRRGAYQTPVPATKGLQVSGGIDIGDRRDVLVRIEHLAQFAPSALDLGEIGHVGHGTAGGQVGQNRNLFRTREDIGHFGHEVHAAEHDVFGVARRRQARKLERVAGKIGVAENLVALVVMPEDHHPLAEFFLGRADTRVALRVGDRVVKIVGQRGCRHGLSLPSCDVRKINDSRRVRQG